MSTMTDTGVQLRRLHLSTHEGHTPGGLWKPLVPANGNTYLGILCAEHLEACVPWVEVELLLVPAYSKQVSLPGQTDLPQATISKGEKEMLEHGSVMRCRWMLSAAMMQQAHVKERHRMQLERTGRMSKLQGKKGNVASPRGFPGLQEGCLMGGCSPCAIRDVRLPVAASAGAISIEDRQGVEEAVVGALKVADGQDHGQLCCQLGKALQHRVAVKGPCQPEMILLLVLAEVGRLEQLLHSGWKH